MVIPGAKKPEQVVANAKAMAVTLSDAEFNEIDQIFNGFKSTTNGKSLADPD